MNSLSKKIHYIKDAIMRELYPERYMVTSITYKDEMVPTAIISEETALIPETRNQIPEGFALKLHKDYGKVMYRIVNYSFNPVTKESTCDESHIRFYPTKIGMDCQLTKCDNGAFSPLTVLVGEKLDLSDMNPKWTPVRVACFPHAAESISD